MAQKFFSRLPSVTQQRAAQSYIRPVEDSAEYTHQQAHYSYFIYEATSQCEVACFWPSQKQVHIYEINAWQKVLITKNPHKNVNNYALCMWSVYLIYAEHYLGPIQRP